MMMPAQPVPDKSIVKLSFFHPKALHSFTANALEWREKKWGQEEDKQLTVKQREEKWLEAKLLAQKYQYEEKRLEAELREAERLDENRRRDAKQLEGRRRRKAWSRDRAANNR